MSYNLELGTLCVILVSGDRPIGCVEEKPEARKRTAPTKKESASVDNTEKNCILLTALILLYVKCGHCQTSLCDQILSVLSCPEGASRSG